MMPTSPIRYSGEAYGEPKKFDRDNRVHRQTLYEKSILITLKNLDDAQW